VEWKSFYPAMQPPSQVVDCPCSCVKIHSGGRNDYSYKWKYILMDVMIILTTGQLLVFTLNVFEFSWCFCRLVGVLVPIVETKLVKSRHKR
jgi:hypothetical protein